MTEFTTVPSSAIRDSSISPPLILDVRQKGLTLAEALAPDTFSRAQTRLEPETTLRVVAVDGRCWATVVGVSEIGGLIIEPDAAPVAAPRRGRPPKVADAA